MNGGKFKSKQVIPYSVIRETLQPASITASVPEKNFEVLNSLYGMGRTTVIYKGHYKTDHGGAIDGIYSNVSFMPADSIGVIVFTNATHSGQLPVVIANSIYDRVLGLEETPWSERALNDYLRNKQTDKEARKKPDVDRIRNTTPSHRLEDYAGRYEDPAYGVVEITHKNNGLRFYFNNAGLELQHYQYDRFVTPDIEIEEKWSLNFITDPQGSIHQVKISIDQKEVTFIKMPDPKLTDPEFLKNLVGQYGLNGTTITIIISNKELMLNTSPPQHLEPYRDNTFRIRELSDQTVEFIFDKDGIPIALKLTRTGRAMQFSKIK